MTTRRGRMQIRRPVQDNPWGFYEILHEEDHIEDSDLEGHRPGEQFRSKHTYPYSYSPFTIWGHPGPNDRCNGSEYTDRLEQWDYKKYDRLSKEIYWVNGEPQRPFQQYGCRGDLIQEFLRRYHDDQTIELLRVIEYCNWSSGYPLWRLDYHTDKHP